MDKNKAYQLWEERFPNRDYVYDYAAQKIVKEDFENEASSYSWTIDFIKPLSSGGFNQESNYLICSTLTKMLRQNKLSFRIGNAVFEVRKGKRYGTFSLFDVTDRNHPFDVSTVTEEMLEESYHLKRQKELYGRERQNSFVLPDLGNIRNNIVKENAPDIQMEYEEKKEENAIEPSLPVEETVVEEKTVEPVVDEAPVIEELVTENDDAVLSETEKTPAETTESTLVAEEEPTVEEEHLDDEVKVVPLADEEENTVDERNVLFSTMKKEAEEADELRSLYHQDIAEKEKEKQTINTLSSSCLLLKENLVRLNEKLLEEKKKLEEYKAQISLNDENKEKENQEVITSLNNDNASLKAELGKQYNEYEILQAQYHEICSKYASLEQEKKELEDSLALASSKDETIKQIQQEKDELNAQIAKLQEAIKEKEEEFSSLNADLESMKTSLTEKENEITRLHSLCAESSSKEDSMNSEFNQKKNDYERMLNEKESENITLKNDNRYYLNQIDQFKTEKVMQDERFRNVSLENDELRKQIQDIKESSSVKEDEKEKEYQELNQKYEDLKKENESLSSAQIAYTAEKESILSDKEALYDKTVQLNVKLNENQTTIDKLTQENESLQKELEENQAAHKEAVSLLMKQKAEADGKVLFMTCGGDVEHYPEYLFYLADSDKTNTQENALEALALYPSWHRKDEQRVSTLLDGEKTDNANVSLLSESDVSYLEEEKENREKALSYWAMKYGDIDQTTDFAGRVININNYLDKDNSHGWNYIKVNSHDREYDGNIVIANMRTLLDYKESEDFKSNGQSFKVVEENGAYHIESKDYVTDPYNLNKTLQITKENLAKRSPFIYLFVKVLGNNNAAPDSGKLLEFYDLIDRTVRRTCSRSFIEMKTMTGSANYAFLTFDGTIDGSYKEALDYALLLNSYRNEFRKEENGINAVIILNQVEIPYSYRHFGFEQTLALSKDVEMRAISYEFIQTAIVNSTIRKTIHIGPSILDNLPLDQSSLKESYIGQTKSFSEIYNFKKRFYTYNFVFSLKKESKEDGNN
ncbi:MAG: hypothetical protein SOR23_00055 [Candidatus Enterosoma sp.]|nr:hypothetical protein [Candidatus Enterosoma sp.]